VPHFTLPISLDGALLDAVVLPSAARQEALVAEKIPVPAPITIRALIDTGANCSAVDPSVIFPLGLTPTGTAQVITPSTGMQPHTAPQYDIMLVIPGAPGHPPATFPTIAVLAVDLLEAQGFHALIGRDLLADCVFIYNGATKLFTFAY
jgi:hypothetical protein